METKLIIELIRAKMINAKREKEGYEKLGSGQFIPLDEKGASMMVKNSQHLHWEGQEIAFKQLLDILEA